MFLHASVPVSLTIWFLLGVAEMTGPWLAERRRGGTPWHPHHIAERFGLLAIIALGEGVVGTVASLSAVVGEHGWTVDAIVLAVAGTGLTFGMWWVYFVVPAADVLHVHPERSFVFGYSHIAVFGAIVATGAGLHTAAYFVEHHSELGEVGTLLSVVIPVAVFIVLVYALYAYLLRTWDWFHLLLMALTGAVLLAAALMALAGVSLAVCLLVTTLAPMVSVVGFEVLGHRHADAAIAASLADGR
jgi:low temperature requirement protein LtrA